jgi:hypothetical protein
MSTASDMIFVSAKDLKDDDIGHPVPYLKSDIPSGKRTS